MKTTILFLTLAALLSLAAATQIPPLHCVTHTDQIGSDGILRTDYTYDAKGRNIYVVAIRVRGKKRERSTTTITYRHDSILYTYTGHNRWPTRITTLDSLGNERHVGGYLTFDADGRVIADSGRNDVMHYTMQGPDIAESYGWSGPGDHRRSYHSTYSYYPDYDTRSYGPAISRQERHHLLRTAETVTCSVQGIDSVHIDYRYEYGNNGRILTETHMETGTYLSHIYTWTIRYTYAD